MASAALLGFTKGFFEERNKMIDAEQERRDKLTSALQALQMEGMKERVDMYNKEKKMWAEVNANLESDPTMAMATYAKAQGLQDYFKALGEEQKWTGNVTKTKEALRQAYDKWKSMPAPEFDISEIEKIQLRRAIDDDTIGGFIRSAFGVEPKNTMYTPNKGLAKMSDTEVEALAQAMYTEQADTTPATSTTTPISSLFMEKPDEGDKPRIDFYERPTDEGGMERVGDMYHPRTGAYLGEVGGPRRVTKMPEEPEALDEMETRMVYGTYNDMRQAYANSTAEKDKTFSETVLTEGVGDIKFDGTINGKSGPLYPYFLRSINQYRQTYNDPAVSAQYAVEDLKTAYDLGMIDARGGWTFPVLGNRIGGEDAAFTPLSFNDFVYRVEEAAKRGVPLSERSIMMLQQQLYPEQWKKTQEAMRRSSGQ